MNNKAMERKIQNGECIDLSVYPNDGKHYIITRFIEDVDYCDAKNETWMWSVGRRISDNVLIASTTTDLYQNPEYECLWLR